MINKLKRVSDFIFELPVGFKKGMRVPGKIFGGEGLVRNMDDAVFNQLANVSMLPGIVRHSL